MKLIRRSAFVLAAIVALSPSGARIPPCHRKRDPSIMDLESYDHPIIHTD